MERKNEGGGTEERGDGILLSREGEVIIVRVRTII